jgi:hypothetical protein
MVRGLSGRRGRLLAVAAAALAASVGGYAYASGNAAGQQYTGCLLNGTIQSVAIGSASARPCANPATQISWNQSGPPPTVTPEPAGTNCANGGVLVTGTGSGYVCNGSNGGGNETVLGGHAVAPAFGDSNSTPPTLDIPLLTIPNIAELTITTCAFDPNVPGSGFDIVKITNLASSSLDIADGGNRYTFGPTIPPGGSHDFESGDIPPTNGEPPSVQTWQFLPEDTSDSRFATVFLTSIVRGTDGCVATVHAIAH